MEELHRAAEEAAAISARMREQPPLAAQDALARELLNWCTLPPVPSVHTLDLEGRSMYVSATSLLALAMPFMHLCMQRGGHLRAGSRLSFFPGCVQRSIYYKSIC